MTEPIEKIEISEDTPLEAGDVIEMHYNVIGDLDQPWKRAVQLYLIERSIKRTFPYCTVSYQNLPDKVIYTVKIGQPPPPAADELPVQQAGILTPILITTAVIGGGLFCWLSLDKVYKITSSGAGKVALVGAGGIGIALLIVAVLLVFSKFGRGG
jgi:hypothetical protein